MGSLLDPELIKGIVVTAITGFFGWLGIRKINASSARKTDREAARDDFELLKKTWREENEKLRREIAADSAAAEQRIAALTERIAAVEALLLDEQGDSAALVEAIRLLMDWIGRHYPDETPPELPARAQQRLERL